MSRHDPAPGSRRPLDGARDRAPTAGLPRTTRAGSPVDGDGDARSLLEGAVERLAALPLEADVVADLDPHGLVQVVRDSPGLYHLRIERADLLVQHARLLHRLLQERRWLEAAVHHLASGVVIMDPEGRVVGFNLAMERLSGQTPEDAVGREAGQVFRLVRADDHQPVPLPFVPAPQAAEPAERAPVEMLLLPSQGPPVDVEVTFEALVDERGEHLGAILSVRDIRSRKERERLERIFLSSVSHELQTPVAVIKGFAGLLADPAIELTLEQRRHHASIILAESERLSRLVSDLLDTTRLQSGGLSLDLGPVEVSALLGRVASKLEPAVVAGRCTLQRAETPGLLVWADAQRVEQILLNLLDNAVRYARQEASAAPEPPRIVLEAHARGEWVELSVSDDGGGVRQADRERIFRAFDRGAKAAKPPGSGLGLFVCKALVEAHRGSLGVGPSAMGGARFWFTLPRYQ
jgi:PAS domain S-box-containing protein